MLAPQFRKDLARGPALAPLGLRQTFLHGGMNLGKLGVRFVERFLREFAPLLVFADQAFDVRFCSKTFGSGLLPSLSLQIRGNENSHRLL